MLLTITMMMMMIGVMMIVDAVIVVTMGGKVHLLTEQDILISTDQYCESICQMI